MCMALGGRAAEAKIFRRVTTGIKSDMIVSRCVSCLLSGFSYPFSRRNKCRFKKSFKSTRRVSDSCWPIRNNPSTLKIGGFVLLLRNHFRPFGQSIGRSSFRQSVGRFVSYFHIVILLSCCPLFVFFLLIPCGTFVVEACVASWLYSQAAFILTFHFFLKEPKTIFGK